MLESGARGIEYRSDLGRVAIAILLYRLAEDSGLVLKGTFHDLIQAYCGPRRHENMWLRGEENLWYHLRKLFQEFRRRYGGVPISLKSPGEVEFDDDRLKEALELACSGAMAPGKLKAEWIGIGYERTIVGSRRSSSRRKAGTYHTPSYLVQYLLKATLGVRLEAKLKELEKAFAADDIPGVQRVVDEVRALKVCDPSCGCGVFLLHAMDCLVEFYEAYNGLWHEWTADAGVNSLFDRHLALKPVVNPAGIALEENIRGVEINREAMLLAAALLTMRAISGRKSSIRLESYAGKVLHCGDALAWGPAPRGSAARSIDKDSSAARSPADEGEHKSITRSQRVDALFPKTPMFDWNIYFPDVFGPPGEDRDEAAGFDFIVGNPPWGASLVTGDKYLKKRFRLLGGQNPDSYKYFVHLGYELLKEGGRLAFVLPNSLMDMELHTNLRSFLLKKTQIEQVINLSSSIFTDGKIPAMLLIFAKTEPDLHKRFTLVDLSRGTPRLLQTLDIEKAPRVKQKRFLETLGYRFLAPRSKEEEDILAAVRDQGCPLEEALATKISRGLVTGLDKYFVFDTCPEWLPRSYCRTIVKGREIKPFKVVGERYLLTLDEPPFGDLAGHLKQRFKASSGREPESIAELMELRSPRPDELFVSPKIMLLRTGRRLVAAPDLDRDLAAVDTLYIIRPREDNHLLYLTALLNSCLYNWLYQAVAGSSKDIFPEIRPAPLHVLPFVVPPVSVLENINTAVEAIRELLETSELSAPQQERLKALQWEVESIIFKLYNVPGKFQNTLMEGYF